MGWDYREQLDLVTGVPGSYVPVAPPAAKESKPVVLVDMDNTVVDWDATFIRRFAQATDQTEAAVSAVVRSRKHFEMEENFSPEEGVVALRVIKEEGFYRHLTPLPGAVAALKAMVDEDIAEVRIVTSPHPTCPGSCAAEKYAFLLEHFGEDWIDRMTITRDKTSVKGDYLVDDKPEVTGKSKAEWTHILFDQSYNKEVANRERIQTWEGHRWRDVLNLPAAPMAPATEVIAEKSPAAKVTPEVGGVPLLSSQLL